MSPAVIQQMENSVSFMGTGGAQGPRHQDWTSKGVLWKALWTNSNLAFFTSIDEGTTWTWVGAQTQIFDGLITHAGAFSFHIDADDYLHLIYERYGAAPDARTTKAVITYRRAILTADHRGIASWTPQQEWAGGNDYWHNVDIVAIKMPDATYVHMTWSYNWSGNNTQHLMYHRIKWVGGTMTIELHSSAIHTVAGGGTTHCRSSISFRHSGDGKMPQIVNGVPKPDVWILYSIGYSLHAASIPYNGTTWQVVSVAPIRNGYSNFGGNNGLVNGMLYEQHRWTRLMYDPISSKLVAAGCLINSAVTTQWFAMWERPADGGTWVESFGTEGIYAGDACLDRRGDLWFVAVRNANWGPPNSNLKLLKVNRNVIGVRTVQEIESLDATANEPHTNMMQYPRLDLHILWTDGTANPYAIKLGRYALTKLWVRVNGTFKRVSRHVRISGLWPQHPTTKL